MQVVHVFINHYEVIDVCLSNGPTPFGKLFASKVHWLNCKFECLTMGFIIDGPMGEFTVRL